MSCAILPLSFAEDGFLQSRENMLDFPVTRIETPVIARHNASDIIYATNFSSAVDINEDSWPDHWGKHHGPGYPRYIEAQIVPRRTPFGTGSLQIPILRGGTAIFTPQIGTLSGLTYSGNAYVMSQGLQHNHVFVSLSLLDHDGNVLQTSFSETVINTNGWARLTTPSLLAEHPDTYAVAMGVHIVPTSRQDLSGMVEIGQLSISEHPTIQFDSQTPWQLYTFGSKVEINGRIATSSETWSQATLEIRDAYGNIIESRPVAKPEHEMPIPGANERPFANSGRLPVSSAAWESASDGSSAQNLPQLSQYGFQWAPTIEAPGFYSVTLSLPMPGVDPYTLKSRGATQSTSFVVIKPYSVGVGGNFGWSLPVHTNIDDCVALKPLLNVAGISLLKYPLWLDVGTSEATWHDHAQFCEWLVGEHIRGIGVLAEPPQELLAAWQREFQLTRHGMLLPPIAQAQANKGQAVVADDTLPYKPTLDIGSSGNIFNLPQERWLPSVETTIFRLGMMVPGWQFGGDGDMSLTGFGGLETLLQMLDARLKEHGLDTLIGIPWDWVYPFPQFGDEPRDSTMRFLSLDNQWPLTADDLAYYLDASSDSNVKRFVQIDLLDKRRYSLEERIIDLVRRLVTAQEHGASAMFLSRPFDENRGVFSPSGKPGELFLPWRTSALMISGRQALGRFDMPGGSENHLFRNAYETSMVVWNPVSTEETLFLGNDCQIVDVWGRENSPESDHQHQKIPVGAVPIFVRNINHDVAMIRQNCRLESSNIPSRYGEPIANKLYFTNTTGEPLSGQLTIVAPPGVDVRPNTILLNLMGGETLERDLALTLSAQATSGPQMLRVQVNSGLRDARVFDTYHPIDIGGGDISIDFSTRLNRSGELEVQQAFINDGQEIADFTCTLYIPNHPLQKMQIRNQGFGRSDYTYTIPNGRSLIGKKLRLVAKDNNSRRILKYEIDIEP